MMAALIAWMRRTVAYFFGQSWVRFGIVGVAATLSYAVIGLALAHVGVPVLLGNALAYALSFAVSYLGHYTWSFQTAASHRSALPRFAATQAGGLGLNTVIIAVLMHFGLPYVLAMPVAIVAVPVVVYFVSKFWVFRSPAAHMPAYPPAASPSGPSEPSGLSGPSRPSGKPEE